MTAQTKGDEPPHAVDMRMLGAYAAIAEASRVLVADQQLGFGGSEACGNRFSEVCSFEY